MAFLQQLRRRYRNLSDAEFERFLRFAAANEFHRIPAVYRNGFMTAGRLFQPPSVSVEIFDPSTPHLFGEPTKQERASADLALRMVQQEQQRRQNLLAAQQIRELEQQAWNQLNPLVRFGFGLWDFVAPVFRATGTVGSALIHAGLAFLPFSVDQNDPVRRLKAAYYTLSGMFTDMFDPNAPMLDPEDYYTLGLAKATDPNIHEKIRRGEENKYFDVIKATIIKKDGTVEERWIAPYEEAYLRSDPNIAAVQLDESTRKANTDRIRLFGREFNKHYLAGFVGSVLFDPSNFATLGSGIAIKGLTRPLSALDDAIRILKHSPIKGAIGIGLDIAAAPYTIPFTVAGRALGFGVRRLPSVAERAMQSPILRNPVVETVEQALDNISSVFLPFFYNLENRGVKPSTILQMIRPLYNLPKEGRQAFVREAPEKVERVMAEWGSEGTDFSDESWDFIKTTLNIKEDVPMGSRKEWIAKNGKMQDLAHTMTLWSNPHPVIQNFADYWEAWKPAAQVWRAGLHVKQLFENIGFTQQSDWRRVLYPIVRLWDENQATMEEVGRQVRQAQQAIIDKQGDTAIAFTKALTGNPEFEQTDLGKAVREHQEAAAKLKTEIPAHQRPRYLKLMAQVLDEAGVAITDENSAVRLLDLFSNIVSAKWNGEGDAFRLALQSPDAAHQYLRSKGILTQSPEHSYKVMHLLNSRNAKALVGDLMKRANKDEYMDALRKYNQTVVELRRHGLSPEMAAGLENIYYTMRTIYDTMTPEQRIKFQQEFGRLTTALMTGQAFDPRELREFYKWMDDNNISATVKETVEAVLEHTANKSLLEPFVAAQANQLRPGMIALMRELDRQRYYRQRVERISRQVKQMQDVDPCL